MLHSTSPLHPLCLIIGWIIPFDLRTALSCFCSDIFYLTFGLQLSLSCSVLIFSICISLDPFLLFSSLSFAVDISLDIWSWCSFHFCLNLVFQPHTQCLPSMPLLSLLPDASVSQFTHRDTSFLVLCLLLEFRKNRILGS